MATLTAPPAVTLTYEAYVAEPQTEGRYEIVNGVRIFMPGATWRHQRIANNIGRSLHTFEQRGGLGITVSAPYDILIRRVPRLQTRQPDVLFVTHTRITRGGGIPDVGPLEVAPKLVVEVISDSETRRILGDKLADYGEIGVDECWVVRPEDRTVEVLTLTPVGAQSVAIYGNGEAVTSVAFPALSVPIAGILAP